MDPRKALTSGVIRFVGTAAAIGLVAADLDGGLPWWVSAPMLAIVVIAFGYPIPRMLWIGVTGLPLVEILEDGLIDRTDLIRTRALFWPDVTRVEAGGHGVHVYRWGRPKSRRVETRLLTGPYGDPDVLEAEFRRWVR